MILVANIYKYSYVVLGLDLSAGRIDTPITKSIAHYSYKEHHFASVYSKYVHRLMRTALVVEKWMQICY